MASHVRELQARVADHLGIKRVDYAGRSPWHVLRGGGAFTWYFTGSVVSDFGTWLQNTAQVVLAYQLAHSVLLVGLVTFAQFTSPLLLGPFAGVLTDRFGGRRVLLSAQLISAIVAAALAGLDFDGALSAWVLVTGAVLGGLMFTLALPARNVTVQRLVPPEKLQPAYAMDTVSYNLGRAVAPLVTMTIGPVGVDFAWAFAANALSFLVFSMILWRILLSAAAEPERRSRIRDGFQIARRDGRVMVLLLMVAAVTVADDPILVLGPALARQMDIPAMWSGWFIAALGAGTVAGSFRRSAHQHSLRLAATALAALALFMLLFVFSQSLWMAIAAALGAGASCLVANSVTRAVLAEKAGLDRAAAVMAVWAIAWAGSKPVASLVDGLLGSWIGPQWTGMVLAAPALIPVTVIALFPRLGAWLTRVRDSGQAYS